VKFPLQNLPESRLAVNFPEAGISLSITYFGKMIDFFLPGIKEES